MQNLMRYIPAPWPSVVVLAAVLYLTLSPMPLPPMALPEFNGWDKMAHFIMFGGLAICFVYDTRRMKHRSITLPEAAVIIACVTLLGGAIELLQGTELINRSCDLSDFIANAAGAVTFGFLGFFYNKKSQPK